MSKSMVFKILSSKHTFNKSRCKFLLLLSYLASTWMTQNKQLCVLFLRHRWSLLPCFLSIGKCLYNPFWNKSTFPDWPFLKVEEISQTHRREKSRESLGSSLEVLGESVSRLLQVEDRIQIFASIVLRSHLLADCHSLSVIWGHLLFSSHSPLHLQTSNGTSVSDTSQFWLLYIFFASSWRKFSVFKGSCERLHHLW